MDKVIIYGDGSLAIDACRELNEQGQFEVAGFTAEQCQGKAPAEFGLPFVPFANVSEKFPADEYKMLVAVGFRQLNNYRAKRYEMAKKMGYQFINCVNSQCHSWSTYTTGVGDNCQFGPRSVVHPTAKIGKNVIIGPGAMVAHLCVVEDHCYIDAAALINGSVRIGAYSYIGANANLRNRVNIGRECMIGAGALIMDDIDDREVCVGKAAPVSTTMPVTE